MPSPASRPVTSLLITEHKGSVLSCPFAQEKSEFQYNTFGYRSPTNGQPPLLGFNGEIQEKPTGTYLLGNGYRTYSPVLMRFTAPDNLSPFDRGGLNTYAYCMNDPVNRVDPTGHVFVKALLDLSYRPRDRRQSYAGTSSELKKGTASSMLKRTSSLPDLTSPVTHSTTVSPSRSPEASSAEYIQPLVGSQSAPESHPIQQVNPITVSGFMNITKINLDRAFRVFSNPDATPTEIIRAASDLEEAAKKIYTRVHYSQQHNIYQ